MFPYGPPEAYARQITHELRLIDQLGYAPYFLTVHAIVTEAKRRGILCQGRGSAANSCVCFMLGITSIDPIKHELLFERFVSGERKEPPDIDVDFEHERREEIIQWIYATYGRHRAALTAVVTRYRTRGAVAEVGKALGLPRDLTKMLTGLVWGWSAEGITDEQIESRAQMSMLPRIKPAKFYDLVIEVAIVRPGPIQGDMVHPYLRRREGKEKPEYPKPELRAVLGKTLGVPLFQEQAMKVAIVGAGFTPAEADQLRRAMATFKMTGGVSHFYDKLVGGMVARGYAKDFAERTFKQIEGFGSYGFPESHAASFAKIAYASCWMKYHHPDVFCAALLNAQPMGFYAPAQIVADARKHGVEVRPVSINDSHWDCTLEYTGRSYLAVRLGFRQVRGLANVHGARIIAARGEAPLSLFAAADASESRFSPEVDEPMVTLAPLTEGREVVEDYRSLQLSLRAHPISFLRDQLDAMKITRCGDLPLARDGRSIEVAGVVLVRQRPGSAKGVLFITIEDETGIANGILWPDKFEIYRRQVMSASMIAMRGRLQKEGEIIHVICDRIIDHDAMLRSIGRGPLPLAAGRGDGVRHGGGPDPRDHAFPKGRVLAAPSFRVDGKEEEVLPIRSHDFH